MMGTTEEGRLGVLSAAALALMWTVMSLAVLAAAWFERERSAVRFAAWGSLWLFTVLVPTLNARVVHRTLSSRELAADAPCRRELARLGPRMLMAAGMALLSAFALILGR